MKTFTVLLLVMFFSPLALAVEPANTRLVGHYTNMKVEGSDDPHFLSGYNISLYQQPKETRAYIMVAIGSPDPTRATVSNLTYDPARRCLTFTAQYSSGLETNPLKGATRRESFKVVFFRGVVRPETIKGTMGEKDFYCTECKPVFRSVTLKRVKGSGRTGEMQAFPE
jgi:hypothetical protein